MARPHRSPQSVEPRLPRYSPIALDALFDDAAVIAVDRVSAGSASLSARCGRDRRFSERYRLSLRFAERRNRAFEGLRSGVEADRSAFAMRCVVGVRGRALSDRAAEPRFCSLHAALPTIAGRRAASHAAELSLGLQQPSGMVRSVGAAGTFSDDCGDARANQGATRSVLVSVRVLGSGAIQ